MKYLSTIVTMALVPALWVGAAMAGQNEGTGLLNAVLVKTAPAKAASAKGSLNSPRVTSGEIVDVTPGQLVQIKEETGRLHTYGLSKKTMVEGILKVGAKAEVTSVGRWAEQITVQPLTDLSIHK
jgi:hypothetical protein